MPRLITYYQKLLGKNAPWFRLNIRVFVAGLVVGFLAMMFFFEPILQLVQQGLDALAEIATNVDETNYIGKVWIIWQNNMLTTGVMIFSGFFLGYLSLLAMFSNALIIGALFVVAGSEGLGGILTIIVSVMPHGVFEIPALIIAGGAGVKLGWEWLLPSAKGKRKQTLNNAVFECLALYALVAVLLLIAACIESYLFILFA